LQRSFLCALFAFVRRVTLSTGVFRCSLQTIANVSLTELFVCLPR
jgi:hypothetical protein